MMISESPHDTSDEGHARPGRLVPRILARVIDVVVVGAVGGVLGVLMEFSFVWLALQAALVFGYFVALDVTAGTTLGKRLLGLRVAGPTGAPPTIGQAAGREAFTLLGAIPFAGPLLALAAWIAILVTINSNPTAQGLHDTVGGGTRVIEA